MKKFIATLILSLLSVLCVFAVTACGGGNEKEKEIKTTVTEDEWETALSSIYDGKHSVESKSVITNHAEAHGPLYLYHYWYDKTNEAVRLLINDSVTEYNLYFWHGSDDKYYTMEERKEEIDKKEFEETIEMMAISYTGNGLIYEANNGSFDELTYDEENKEYKGTLVQNGNAFDYTMKFEDGKLVKFVGVNEEIFTIVVDYKYDVKVTIPKDVIDLPVG